jgi:hypothetical protein
MEIKFNKWEWENLSDEILKGVAKDIYNQKIFTSNHLSEYDNIGSVFMAFIFMGGIENDLEKTYENDDIVRKRQKKLYNLNMLIERDKYFEEKGTTAQGAHDKWYSDIGIVYEYLSEAGPMAINGKPTFLSMKLMNKEDSKKLWEFYEQYKEIRETADNF